MEAEDGEEPSGVMDGGQRGEEAEDESAAAAAAAAAAAVTAANEGRRVCPRTGVVGEKLLV